LSTAIAEIQQKIVRPSPGAVALGVMTCVFAVAAGYGWLGESRDYSNYLSVYNALTPTSHLSSFRFERGYMFASWFCKIYIGMSFTQYYTILVAISLALKFRLIWKHTSAPIVAAIIYLLLLYPFYEYTQMRAAIAYAFAYAAIDKYLDGRRETALLLAIVAVLFHNSAIALVAGAIMVLLVSKRPPIFVAGLFAAMAIISSFMISPLIPNLQLASPLIAAYMDKGLYHAPPLLYGRNVILLFILVCSTIFLRPWQTQRDGFFYYLNFWALMSFLALLRIPVFAFRISEAFIFSFFLFTFRFDNSHQSRIPVVLMILFSGKMIYTAISDGWIMVP